MRCHPAFLLTDIEKYVVNPFFGRRSRIKIVGKHFMQLVGTAVYTDLPAVKMSMPKWWCHIDDCPRPERFFNRSGIYKRLQLRNGKCEKSSVAGADEQ